MKGRISKVAKNFRGPSLDDFGKTAQTRRIEARVGINLAYRQSLSPTMLRPIPLKITLRKASRLSVLKRGIIAKRRCRRREAACLDNAGESLHQGDPVGRGNRQMERFGQFCHASNA